MPRPSASRHIESSLAAGNWLNQRTLLMLLTGVLAAVGLLLVHASMSQRAARKAALAAGDAELAARAVLISLTEAESGQRGYLLTKDEAYLKPYGVARGRLNDEVRLMKSAVADGNHDTTMHLAEIDRLIESKLDELDNTVALEKSGQNAAAIASVSENGGNIYMDRLRGHITTLAAIKRQQRNVLHRKAEAAFQRQIPLLFALWLILILLVLAGFRGERKRAEAEAVAGQAAALREANQRTSLLARELNHRIKNLFGVVLSVISLASRRTGTKEEVLADIRGRIHALERSHSAALDTPPDSPVPVRPLFEKLLAPYREDAEGRVEIIGPDAELPPHHVTPLGLIVHELATNAAKYGALSVPGGRLTVDWSASIEPGHLVVIWRETGAPTPSVDPAASTVKGGFGTRMIMAALTQINGRKEREWLADGTVVRLFLPLNDAAADQTR